MGLDFRVSLLVESAVLVQVGLRRGEWGGTTVDEMMERREEERQSRTALDVAEVPIHPAGAAESVGTRGLAA